MARNGLFINYDYCTGCFACEVACKQEHDFSEGRTGIKVNEVVTEKDGNVHVDFIPMLTRFCDLCGERTAAGDVPACVKHCQSICMQYGPITELAKALEEKPRSLIYAPR